MRNRKVYRGKMRFDRIGLEPRTLTNHQFCKKKKTTYMGSVGKMLVLQQGKVAP